MKIFNKIALIGIAASVTLFSCKDDETPVPTATNEELRPNIYEAAKANSELSVYARALEITNIAAIQSNVGSKFTALAPNNTAFNAALNTLGHSSIEDVDEKEEIAGLKKILLYHLYNGELSSEAITAKGKGYLSAYQQGQGHSLSLFYNTESGVVFNGQSKVITADIKASNGVIHIVDAVILPPTVATFIAADPNFSTLLSAATRESDYTYVQTLSNTTEPPAPFTVFAPNNEAFTSLLSELSLTELADIPKATLTSTINTHVVSKGNFASGDLEDKMEITTLGGKLLARTKDDNDKGLDKPTLKDPKDRISEIISTDIQATNGVIHTINKVLLDN